MSAAFSIFDAVMESMCRNLLLFHNAETFDRLSCHDIENEKSFAGMLHRQCRALPLI